MLLVLSLHGVLFTLNIHCADHNSNITSPRNTELLRQICGGRLIYQDRMTWEWMQAASVNKAMWEKSSFVPCLLLRSNEGVHILSQIPLNQWWDSQSTQISTHKVETRSQGQNGFPSQTAHICMGTWSSYRSAIWTIAVDHHHYAKLSFRLKKVSGILDKIWLVCFWFFVFFFFFYIDPVIKSGLVRDEQNWLFKKAS